MSGYTEEELREGMNTMKNNLMNFYKDYSREELVESIVVILSGTIHLNQQNKELREKIQGVKS